MVDKPGSNTHCPRIADTLMKKSIFLLLSLVSFCVLTACSKKPDEEGYYFMSGTVDDGVEIYLNGNPLNQGHAMSLFVVEGTNRIELRGEFKDEGYSLMVTKTKNLFSSDFRKIVERSCDVEAANNNKCISFEEENWWHWKWQDADDLQDVGDADFAIMHNMLDHICTRMQQEGFDPADIEANMPSHVWWTEDEEMLERTREQLAKFTAKVKEAKKMIFNRANKEDIEFLVGDKIVLMRATTRQPLYSLAPEQAVESEPDENGWTWNYKIETEEMYFAKFDGDWKLMLPVN